MKDDEEDNISETSEENDEINFWIIRVLLYDYSF